MKRTTLLLLLSATPALGGCLPMMAVSAADMVARSTQKAPVSNEGMQTQARDACTAQAAQYGTVSVIDVEQHRINQIIVWGTVDDGKQKQSFECDFGTKITGFKLRAITSQQ
jgi:hypothetical protein